MHTRVYVHCALSVCLYVIKRENDVRVRVNYCVNETNVNRHDPRSVAPEKLLLFFIIFYYYYHRYNDIINYR